MKFQKRMIAEIIKIELRGLLRNRFLQSTTLINYIWIPFVFIYLDNLKNSTSITFWGCLLSSVPAIGFSAHAFTKDGYYYESIVSRNISLVLYVKTKFLFITMYSVIFGLIIFPLLLLYTNLVITFLFISGLVYYTGFGSFIMLYISSFDKHKINLNISPLFNYEGFSILKLIFVFPVVSPLFIWDETRYWGIGIMAFLGLAGILMRNLFINIIAENLSKRKYKYLMIPVNSSN